MKCEVLIGPIAVDESRCQQGETIDLSDADAEMFERFGFVKILPVTPEVEQKNKDKN